MAIVTTPTPNPNAMKFEVGRQVGGPATVTAGTEASGFAGELIEIEGVTSVFFTPDFITVTKGPSAEWDDILSRAVPILEREFGA